MKMKKHIVIIIFYLLVLNNLLAQILRVNLITQEQNQWCWAAASKCLLDYYKEPVRQCDIAEYTRTSATWYNFGTQNCCDSPSGSCNYWNYPFNIAGSVQDIILHFKNVQSTSKFDSIKLAEVQTEIVNFRPFMIRWLWNNTTNGHFIIGHGIKNKDIYYMNPWIGEGLKIASYDWIRYNSEHTWTHTLVLTTNPVVLSVSANALSIDAPANSTKTFEITSNISWTVSSKQNWLEVNNQSGLGIATITLTAKANPLNTTRTDTIIVSGTDIGSQIIYVTQTENKVTSINENSKISLSIYPNPASKILTINEIDRNANITVFDLTGKILIKKTATSTIEKLDVSSLAKGVYSIKVSDSKSIRTAKLFKL